MSAPPPVEMPADALPSERRKWVYLREVIVRDARHPEIVRIARRLSRAVGGDRVRFAMLAMAAARDAIAYVRDTDQFGGEDIAGLTRSPGDSDPIDAWRRGADDCDAKARFFCALCLAGGLQARMWPLWRQEADGSVLAHVAAQVRLGEWVHAETTLARARLGEVHTQVPKETDGRWQTT